MKSRHDIDSQKRKTLAIFGRLGTVATFASVSSITAASVLASDTNLSSASTQELEITLISSPDVVENSLIVKNVSNNPVSINKFHVGNIVFDGDAVDCNEI